jgi:hypothetical protein
MAGFLKRAACGTAVVVLVFLSGCAGVDSHRRVADWPALKVVEHHLSNREMRDHCAPYMGPLESPLGCTVFYFDLGEAHIYVSKEFPAQFVLEHERLHAAGYDHIGSGGMQAMLNAWKARSTVRVAATLPVPETGRPFNVQGEVR